MSWVLWRQYRVPAVVTGVVIALFTIAIVVTGIDMSHAYNDSIRNCTSNGTCGLGGDVLQRYTAIVNVVNLSIALPIILGVFLGATLIARETENATHIFAWTQTVTRRHWLVTKIASVLLATIVVSAATSALVTWWSGTPNSLRGNRFEGAQFDTQNLVPVAFALFAVGIIGTGLLALPVLAGSAAFAAEPVQKGVDMWMTVSGMARTSFAKEPIPAGFFCEGSQPFTGTVTFRGAEKVIPRSSHSCWSYFN